MATPNPLRSITVRLNATPVEDLPRCAGFLASSILSCAEAIRTAEVQKGETSILLHKLKTRVSSLIQDKSAEGRFTGIVLVKAIIEAGGPQTLTTSGIWARNLLSCLNKQDPPEVKKLCLIAITRIFLLTKDFPALIREITTPALPSFISTSLGLMRPLATITGQTERHVLSPLLQPVLQCWLQLLHQFPATFRPLLPQIRTIILGLASDDTAPEQVRVLAADVLSALHFSAPKGTASLDWFQTCQQIVEATHRTADHVLRSILEEWTSVVSRASTLVNGKVTSNVKSEGTDSLGMSPWEGMHAGCSRIVHLLKLLTTVLISKQAQPVSLPIVEVLDLTARLAAVVPPSTQFSLRQNQEISRDEREELWVQLPRLHEATTDLLCALTRAFQESLKPVMRVVSSQVWEIFEASAAASDVRKATYRAIGTLVDEGKLELMLVDFANLTVMIQMCCIDLRLGTKKLAEQPQPTTQDKSTKSTQLALNSQNGSATPNDQAHPVQSDTYEAAWSLLPRIFTHASSLLTASVRADLDRTAILVGHNEAMLASVLNPPAARQGVKIAPSILPFLARADAGSLAFEALVRPRMPVLTNIDHIRNQIPDEELEEIEAPVYDDQTQQDMEIDTAVQETPQNPMAVSMADSGLTKKRDFASIEPNLMSTPSPFSEAVKRLRSDDILPTEVQMAPIPSDLQDHDTIVVTSSTVVGTTDDHKPQEAAHAASSSAGPISASSSEMVAEQSRPSIATTKQIARDGVNDDSDDDDEIPTIDATLTSDSEDEDDESDEP